MQAGIKALTKFPSSRLDFGGGFFGGFDTPFFAGRNATFYRTIWILLGRLHDADATLAVACKACADALKSFERSSAEDSARLETLKAKIALAKQEGKDHVLKALVAEGLVGALSRVLASADMADVLMAENVLFVLAQESDEAGRLSLSRRFLKDLLEQKQFLSC